MVKKPAVTHKKSMMFNLAHLLYCMYRCEWLIINPKMVKKRSQPSSRKKFVMFHVAQVRYGMSR